MIPKECKRLAEVDFPIATVSKHSAREKSIRHGHPSTLHLWWARRPLGACRAMLLALLLPDPCDEHCPADFKKQARSLLQKTQGHIDADDKGLRDALLAFIGDFADWNNSSRPTYLEVGRGLVKAAHPEETPLVVDPFAGGGSIPLEALRVGCDAFASDLNPVACLILKVLLEDIPRHGPELADELRRAGKEIKAKAEEELAEFYPLDPDGARPIAYLWARTVRCEAPNCGCEIPLARSFWLCKKPNRKRALKYEVVRPKGKAPRVEFEMFEPTSADDVPDGTVSRAKASCPACGTVLPPQRVRAQLREQRGGADVVFDAKGNRTGGARLLAVVTIREDERGRHYRLPTGRDYAAVWKAQKRLEAILDEWERSGRKGLCPVPDEPTPAGGGSGAGRAFSVQKYGMMQWRDLFTARQEVSLVCLSRLCATVDLEACPATKRLTAIVVNRCADRLSTGCRWDSPYQKIANTFSRQALPMVWDFCEGSPVSGATGGYDGALRWVEKVVEEGVGQAQGSAEQVDATEHPLPSDSASVWLTDPPYYDAIPYSDLSDFFFVWLKRALRGQTFAGDPLDPDNLLTPKTGEIVQDETRQYGGRPKDSGFFEATMAGAFSEGRRVAKDDGIGCVVFAHKTTEGWEALLSGMIQGGWIIAGSWPIDTEMQNKVGGTQGGIKKAMLLASIHLVCRPRPEDAPVGDWGRLQEELPKRVGDWMERLQEEGVRGADLVFACIGPALEIYSRYSRVEDADDREIPLGGDPIADEPHERGFLAYVWETVGRLALEQVLGTAEAKARNGAAGAVEEDARLTALFLWTLQSTNGNREAGKKEKAAKKPTGFSLPFDVARRFAQPLGIHLDAWEGRIIETKKGVVRLLPVTDRARQLFGDEGAGVAARRIEERARRSPQAIFDFVEEIEAAPKVKGRRRRRRGAGVSDEDLQARREATTLDRVHAAMLLQSAGRANALRALLAAEKDRGPDFLRLANALSALYPVGSEEKRLLDAMLLAVPR